MLVDEKERRLNMPKLKAISRALGTERYILNMRLA